MQCSNISHFSLCIKNYAQNLEYFAKNVYNTSVNLALIRTDMRKPLTKGQLISMLAEKSEMSKKDVANLWELFVEACYQEVRETGQCLVPGIGKLVKQNRKARMGRNPATGAQIEIPAKTVCKFRVAKAAKDAVL